MPAPVVNSVVANPNQVNPGGASVVTISASDPDDGTITLTATVTDSGGNQATGTGTISVLDSPTYELSAPAGWVVVQRAAPNENIFDVTAPPN